MDDATMKELAILSSDYKKAKAKMEEWQKKMEDYRYCIVDLRVREKIIKSDAARALGMALPNYREMEMRVANPL